MNVIKKVSIIIPSYNEEQLIKNTSEVVSDIMLQNNIPFEILFVDDGSKDGTWKQILSLSKDNSTIHGIHFSRNFGKESAIYAGMQYAKGDCCVVMDCDLQHPPIKIVEMYRLWEQGYEVVEAVKEDRGEESGINRFMANLFYKIISKLTDIDIMNASDFKLLDRKVMLVLLNMKERNSFFRALSSWVGFKTIQVPFRVAEREAGESKWSTKALVKYAILNITSFSSAPMQIVTICGFIMLIISFVFGINSIIQYVTGKALGGFTTVILLELFSSSIIMICLGIIGYYIAQIYEEIKGRPKFIVSEKC